MIDRIQAQRAAVGSGKMPGHAALLLHSFLSPLSNKRTDMYGGLLENRGRLPLMVAEALQEEWPNHLPVFVRIAAVDWQEGGVTLDESVQLARWLRDCGIDLVDCSSGAVVPGERIPVAPGYQMPFAARIRKDADIATAAVGVITQPSQAEDILARGDADLVFLARALLCDPYWAQSASEQLDAQSRWPIQYARAVAQRTPSKAW